MYGRNPEDTAPCGSPRNHPEPCQHAPVDMELQVDNKFDRHHTFDHTGREQDEEKERVKHLVEDNIDHVDIINTVVRTADTRVEVTVDVDCRCYESLTDIKKRARKQVPDRFHIVDDSLHVADRLSI